VGICLVSYLFVLLVAPEHTRDGGLFSRPGMDSITPSSMAGLYTLVKLLCWF
jgi:hypothetical protein